MLEVRTEFDSSSEVYMEAYDLAMESILFDLEESSMNDAITELLILTEAWKQKELVIEAGPVQIDANNRAPAPRQVHGIMNSIRDFFRKIIEFITNAFAKFDETLGNILKTDVDFVNQNAATLTNIPENVINGMKITCIPYFQGKCHNRIMENKLPMAGVLTSIVARLGATAQQRVTADWIYRNYFPELSKLDPRNWRNGGLLYYRGGKAPATVMINDPGGIRNAISAMITYVQNYKRYADACKAMKDGFLRSMQEEDNKLRQLQGEFASISGAAVEGQIVNFGPEQYSVLEDAHLWDTEFGSMKYVDENGVPYLKPVSELSWFKLSNVRRKPQRPIQPNPRPQPTPQAPTPPQRPAQSPAPVNTTVATTQPTQNQGSAPNNYAQQQVQQSVNKMNTAVQNAKNMPQSPPAGLYNNNAGQQPATQQQAQSGTQQQNPTVQQANQAKAANAKGPQQPGAVPQNPAGSGNATTFKTQQDKEAALKDNQTKQQKVRQIMSVYQVASSVVTSKMTVCEEVERSYMKVLRGVMDGLSTNTQKEEADRRTQQYNDQRQQEVENQRQYYREQGRTRQIRRRASQGKVRKAWDWLFGS